MVDGMREIEVRLSMAYYFIVRMNLDLPDLPPSRAQIRAQNLDDVQTALTRAKSDSARRIAERSARPPGQ
jgi:hypothetical protein